MALKVLGIAGSPRRGGNTDLLLQEALRGARDSGAETRVVYLDDLDIAPCRHCDACLVTGNCRQRDEMIYTDLEAADRIVLASPLHFMAVTAQAKAMIDRCQALWARKYVLKQPPLGDTRERKGLFLAVGARTGDNLFAGALTTVKSLFRCLDVAYSGAVLLPGMDERGAVGQHPEALKQAYDAGEALIK
jgi:multimeric flavodoxin WrbA